MEDAMIINKSSHERGFAHGSIYKSEFIELEDPQSYFCRDPQNATLAAALDTDGLPFIGRLMKSGDPLYCFYSEEGNKYIVKKYQGKEDCYVDSVKMCGNFGKGNRVVCVTFRVVVSVWELVCGKIIKFQFFAAKRFGWGQIRQPCRPKGHLFAEVAGGRLAVHRDGSRARHRLQPARFPFAYDHRHDDRDYGGEVGRFARIGARRHAVQIHGGEHGH